MRAALTAAAILEAVGLPIEAHKDMPTLVPHCSRDQQLVRRVSGERRVEPPRTSTLNGATPVVTSCDMQE